MKQIDFLGRRANLARLNRVLPLPLPIAIVLFALGCGEGITAFDGDGDGYTLADGDCWDATESPDGSTLTGADIYPGATETWYDGVDQNCDGVDDNDADADGYAANETGGSDCDDTDAAVNPGAEDTWYDGVDQNCDAANDYDADTDGYEYDETGGDDCNDTRDTINPGAEEICGDGIDQDCEPENCPGLSGELNAAEAITRIVGPEAEAEFGYSMATLGDWGNDGASEILIGAPGTTNGDGAAYVFATPLIEHSSIDSAYMRGEPVVEESAMGHAVSSAANFQGNGGLDLLVSMPEYGGSAGVVFLYDEGTSAHTSTSYRDIVIGDDEGSYFGRAVTSLGDTDGDGYGEVLIGAEQASAGSIWYPQPGAAYLFDGPTFLGSEADGNAQPSDAATVFTVSDSYAMFGESVSGVSDVNGDGIGDWVIGASESDIGCGSCGAAFLFFGPHQSGESVGGSDADVIFTGNQANSGFAQALAPYGDVNGDGNGDIGITAMYTNGETAYEGAVYVHADLVSSKEDLVSASSALYQIQGDTQSFTGVAMTFADLDADDLDDVAFSANLYDNDASGSVYVLYASSSNGTYDTRDLDTQIIGEVNGDKFGDSLLNAGDQNGDGINDLLIGAPNAYGDGMNAGAVYLFSGAAPGD